MCHIQMYLYFGLYIIIKEGDNLMWRLLHKITQVIFLYFYTSKTKKTCPLQRKVPEYTNIYLSTYESIIQLRLVGNFVVYMCTFYWVPSIVNSPIKNVCVLYWSMGWCIGFMAYTSYSILYMCLHWYLILQI